jgi:hypothetical protein
LMSCSIGKNSVSIMFVLCRKREVAKLIRQDVTTRRPSSQGD